MGNGDTVYFKAPLDLPRRKPQIERVIKLEPGQRIYCTGGGYRIEQIPEDEIPKKLRRKRSVYCRERIIKLEPGQAVGYSIKLDEPIIGDRDTLEDQMETAILEGYSGEVELTLVYQVDVSTERSDDIKAVLEKTPADVVKKS